MHGGGLLQLQKRSADPNPQYFSKSTAVQMGGVLPYKWEAYCSTNGRRTAGFPFLRSLEARKVRRYKWGAYCRTNWRCTAVLFRQVVGVGVSKTLPINGHNNHEQRCLRNPNGGLANGGLARKALIVPKRALSGQFLFSFPGLWGAEELVPIGAEKMPIGPEKAPRAKLPRISGAPKRPDFPGRISR